MIRSSLQPSIHDRVPLPRRMQQDSRQILPLLLFLSRYSATSHTPAPNSPQQHPLPAQMPHSPRTALSAAPDKEETQQLQQARQRSWCSCPSLPSMAPRVATSLSMRSYMPIAAWPRKHAWAGGDVLFYMIPKKRAEEVYNRVCNVLFCSIHWPGCEFTIAAPCLPGSHARPCSCCCPHPCAML